MPINLIDSHAHISTKDFDKDRDEVIERAFSSGIKYILDVVFDTKSLAWAVELADKYDNVYLSAGVHPHESGKKELSEFSSLFDNPKLAALGEIGLDYFRDYAPRDKQREVFKYCLQEAKRRNLPVVIHQRAAQEEVLQLIKEELDLPVRGVMHCFSGGVDWARQCLEIGFMISFAGNITYPKAVLLREVAKEVPLDKLLIETDCPWLAPQPVRGKRCEPVHVQYVAEEIAKIKGISVTELGEAVTGNFERLFLTTKVK